MNKVLAIDMGATSIRGILGWLENDRIRMKEVMRYSHSIVEKDGASFWDWDGLLREIVKTIRENPDVASVGVDTWGVDFGLLDENDELIQPPHSYRDPRFTQGYQELLQETDGYTLFRQTGNQLLAINSLFQWKTMQMLEPDIVERAKTLLLMPDLVNFYLCGAKRAERTISSTTQMYDLKAQEWNKPLVERLGLVSAILPEPIDNKMCVGSTANSRLEALRRTDINVLSVASHDTASAVYMTKAYDDEETLFLSSGTWSLMGCFSREPVLTEEAYANSLTNETGYAGRNMVFQNITGLYLIEKLRHAFEKEEGRTYSFDEIAALVENTPDTVPLIDVSDPLLGQESDDYFGDLEAHLKKNNQPVPEKKTDYFKIIYASLVKTYADLRDVLEKVLGRTFRQIHVMGGGSRSKLFNQMIADGMQMKVLAGPSEATALGNVLSQLEAQTKEDDAARLREIAMKSVATEVYEAKRRH